MLVAEFAKGSVIYTAGNPVQNISFVTKGVVEATFMGQPFRFEQRDMIGISDYKEGSYSTTYTALTDVAILTHPFNEMRDLESLLKDNFNAAHLAVNAACQQLSQFLQYRSSLKEQADAAFNVINDIYPKYEQLSKRFALSAKKLDISGLISSDEIDPIEDWLLAYYTEVKNVEPTIQKAFFYGHPGISSGFFYRGIEDVKLVVESCEAYQDYLKDISKLLISSDGHDLFALIADLHFDSINLKDADGVVTAMMKKVTDVLDSSTLVNKDFYQHRLNAYNENLTAKRSNQVISDVPVDENARANLAESLGVILQYSGLDDEVCNKFARTVQEYTKMPDRGGSEDAAYKLRREITNTFYDIYAAVFLKTLEENKAIPTVIKMFLNFGYMDANLAGLDNADYLYSIADSVKGDKEKGVYTLIEWLTAIYKGEKETSRDDFDMDYIAHVREQKATKRFDAAEEARMLADRDAKLRFELENVFPTVNKITFGRITTFCPLFSDNNVQRGLQDSLVTPALIREAFDDIRALDYSAYYREIMYQNPEAGIPKEYLNVEIQPDVVLMPNVGVRGAMWQEMDGRDRKSSPRMFMSVFLLIDLKLLAMKLTGDYRWEYIKRIQGPRWGDVTDPSLTSEFFNYLQFYRTNRELSMDVRGSIKTELVRARNNYKQVFVSNYTEWLIYESNGSPRLNKFVRNILGKYCPFPEATREKLGTNPQYADILKRHEMNQSQRLRHLSNIIQRVNKAGFETPLELLAEVEFTKI